MGPARNPWTSRIIPTAERYKDSLGALTTALPYTLHIFNPWTPRASPVGRDDALVRDERLREGVGRGVEGA